MKWPTYIGGRKLPCLLRQYKKALLQLMSKREQTTSEDDGTKFRIQYNYLRHLYNLPAKNLTSTI